MGTLTDVLAPQNGEGTRATVLRWYKAIGDMVVKDEPLVELETDKVTVEIASPANGRLVEVLKDANTEVHEDDVLARLGELDSFASALSSAAVPQGIVTPTHARGDAVTCATPMQLSPSVRRLLYENSLTADSIEGSGRNGRITAQDVTRHLNGAASLGKAASVFPGPVGNPVATQLASFPAISAASATSTSIAAHVEVSPGSSRVPHTTMRQRVAEHMARSMVEAPHVTTLFEADLTQVLAHRAAHGAYFARRGARLTLTVYFILACVRALREHPEVNATFLADAMEIHSDVNIGVGTALGNKGLIVPVIHHAQNLNLFGIAQRLGQMVAAARGGKLKPEDVREGTFTISNHGVGGSLLATPIVINQPQVAILGVGKLQRRVCVLEAGGVEAIAVRSMCYVTLTIDHRALDAFQANAFLAMVVGILEKWQEET